MFYNDGAIYDGDWLNGQRNGQGKITYPSGNIYEGDWENGVKQGNGKMTFANGNIYEGGIENNMRQGWGKFIEKDGNGNIVNTYEGSWLNDNPDKTSIAYPELMT